MDADCVDPPTPPKFLETPEASNPTYEPVAHHWFFEKQIKNSKAVWLPFSTRDSAALEDAFIRCEDKDEHVIATDGGRYDVSLKKRQKTPVYWKEPPMEVRRCSWFYKGTTSARFLPYEEDVAEDLEEKYKNSFEKDEWHQRIELPNKDTVVLRSSDVFELFPPSMTADDWNNPQTQVRPRVVKRGIEDFEIDDGEPEKVDHLLFMVHGIGSVCDLKFRTVQEVVDDFRTISLQLVRTHYQSSYRRNEANRVEVLPISWHDELHSEDTGIDRILKSITLDSISRLREFTNDTLLDILFYTSPKYCQQIISTVSGEMNRLYDLFRKRNPNFKGQVSLGGHSLGSLILFDLLAHQQPEEEVKKPQDKQPDRRISQMYGVAGAGHPRIHYPQLNFHPTALFAMGSPIGMFVTVRGLDSLGEDFALPTCNAFFNIFHPYDPVAYRIESLINPKLASLKPMLIPHHKGRKRMHLELKETMVRVGTDLKQKLFDSLKHTWNTLFTLGVISSHANQLEADKGAIEEEAACSSDEQKIETTESLGILNKGRRIDYVLQESPFEIFNEYLSAIMSHVCYWESEDTMLFILKEIYSSMNIKPDNQIPQATMTIERPLDYPGSRRGSAVAQESSKSSENS